MSGGGCLGDHNPRWHYSGQRKALRARYRSLGLPCALCGQPIDYSLPAGHPDSFELDEIIPISKIPPELRAKAAVDPKNTQPAHRRCNARRGAKFMHEAAPPPRLEGDVSRDWLA